MIKIKNIRPQLDNATLTGIDVDLENTETNEVKTVALAHTEEIGVFVNPDWQTTALASLAQEKGFVVKTLSKPIDGNYVGLEINIKNLMKDIEDEQYRKQFKDVEKYICISRQIAMTPALGFAEGIALDQYTPTKCDLCKPCQHKRKCWWYAQSV